MTKEMDQILYYNDKDKDIEFKKFILDPFD
jgi:hypothetical protein